MYLQYGYFQELKTLTGFLGPFPQKMKLNFFLAQNCFLGSTAHVQGNGKGTFNLKKRLISGELTHNFILINQLFTEHEYNFQFFRYRHPKFGLNWNFTHLKIRYNPGTIEIFINAKKWISLSYWILLEILRKMIPHRAKTVKRFSIYSILKFVIFRVRSTVKRRKHFSVYLKHSYMDCSFPIFVVFSSQNGPW